MRLRATNNQYGTHPTVIHAQGLSQPRIHDYFTKLSTIFMATDPPACHCPELTVITTTNYRTLGSLQRSLNHLRLPVEQWRLLGQGLEDFQLHLKIPLVLAAMATVTTPYVLFCDSHDVLVLDLDGLVEKFLGFNCGMVLNAEPFFWPGVHEFEQAGNPKPVPGLLNPSRETELARGHQNAYLNSGVWIARADFVRWLLPFYVNTPMDAYKFWHGQKLQTQDQIHFRHAYRRWPDKIKLDHDSCMFQTLKEAEIWGEDKTLQHRFHLQTLSYDLRT